MKGRWSGPGGLLALVALALGDLAGWLSKRLKRGVGGTLPGRVVLTLAPGVLGRLAQGRKTVLVSGTNGKTTTTMFLAAAARAGGEVVTNVGGANLMSGLVTTLMADRRGTTTAVLEVDEVVLPTALAVTGADLVVLLNLSRDQLDRFGEVASHGTRWAKALTAAPGATVVANADDPRVVAAVREARPDEREVVWVAAGCPWRADTTLCTRCGFAWDTTVVPWRCSSCGLSAPEPAWTLAGEELVAADGVRRAFDLALPGRANAANASVAVAAAGVLGVGPDEALARMRAIEDVDGRYLRVAVGGRDVRLFLAKNPAGWLEVLDQLPDLETKVLLGINARAADGVDPSWLWDVPFEKLQGRDVLVYGECALDLSTRLFYAEVAHEVEPDLRQALRLTAGQDVHLAANYTAFVQARAVVRGAA